MNDSEKIKANTLKLERYTWALAVVWTVVISASLVWNVLQVKQGILKTARIQARVAYDEDIIYRRWNARHGGVYVPVTEETQPNRYLSDIPERDITTPSGKLLTLMNPAYMTRQVHELAREEYKVRGHITSLNPIRPENAPDPWEAEALHAFERGQTEISSVEEIEGEEYMRLMRPLITEKSCLKCHAKQGYEEGDIRGSISVSIPMEPLWAISRMHTVRLALAHALLWLVGMSGIALGAVRLIRSERERQRVEEVIKRRNEELTVLNVISAAVSQFLDLKEVLDAALKKTMEALSVEGGLIYLFDETSQTFAPTVHHGISQDVLREVTGFKMGEGLSGRAAESGKALVVFDLAADPRNISPTASREGLHSYAGVPINSKGKLIGVMTLVTRKAGHFKPNHVNLLNRIGNYIGVAIENALLYEEIKQLAEGIQESEEKYRNLFEYANDSIFILDPSTSRFLDVNENAAKRLGYTREELMELTLDDIAPLYSVERIEANIRELQKGGSIVFEAVHQRKDGTEMPVEISSRLIEYSGRKVIQGFARNITERKRAEKERKRLLNELEEKNKELEQIVYAASHDLRSPLLNIQGFSRELENALKQVYSVVLHSEDVPSEIKEKLAPSLEEDIPEAVQYIFASTSKMDSLLSGLLRLSRLGRAALTIKQLDMNKVMSDVADAFEFQIKEKGVTLQIEELPSCRGDETQINQVFSNLVDNALKYRDPNRPSIIRISGRKEEGQAVYCVEDNGIGIAAEHQGRIYEIFHRLNPEASAGEGLGLTIAHRVLDRHGGKIWVESEPGEGSKFFVSLPTI